jgi:hypothetical protein
MGEAAGFIEHNFAVKFFNETGVCSDDEIGYRFIGKQDDIDCYSRHLATEIFSHPR